MSIAFNVKIQDDVYKEAAPFIGTGRGKLRRNTYMNMAVKLLNRLNRRRKEAGLWKRAVESARESTAEMVTIMDQLDDPLPPWDGHAPAPR